MKIILPVSTCCDAPQLLQQEVVVLRQTGRSATQSLVINSSNLATFAQTQLSEEAVRLDPVAPQTFVRKLNETSGHADVALLHAEDCFDETVYNYLIQTSLYRAGQIHHFGLGCYGHALSYLCDAVVRFQREYAPSLQQLALFIEQLNRLLHVFVVGQRNAEFEPATPAIWRSLYNLVCPVTFYERVTNRWQRVQPNRLKTVITAAQPKGSLIWVDSYRGVAFANEVISQLSQWGLRDPKMVQSHHLLHIGAPFPDRFAFVTVTPDRQHLARVRAWAQQMV